MESIFNEIAKEREYQDNLWGGSAHDDQHTSRDWTVFVIKRLGKMVEAHTLWDIRDLWIKVAALAVAAIEAIDRKLLND